MVTKILMKNANLLYISVLNVDIKRYSSIEAISISEENCRVFTIYTEIGIKFYAIILLRLFNLEGQKCFKFDWFNTILRVKS